MERDTSEEKTGGQGVNLKQGGGSMVVVAWWW